LIGVVIWLHSIGIRVELVVVLGVLTARIALVGWRRSLFLRVLLGARLGRRAYFRDTAPGWLRLAVVHGRHVGVGRVGSGVVGSGGRLGSLVASGDSYCSDKSRKTDAKT
jgi:hypothetical protein